MQTGSYIKAKAPFGAHALGGDLLRGFLLASAHRFIFCESYSDAP
jgi:hypothetical protein